VLLFQVFLLSRLSNSLARPYWVRSLCLPHVSFFFPGFNNDYFPALPAMLGELSLLVRRRCADYGPSSTGRSISNGQSCSRLLALPSSISCSLSLCESHPAPFACIPPTAYRDQKEDSFLLKRLTSPLLSRILTGCFFLSPTTLFRVVFFGV